MRKEDVPTALRVALYIRVSTQEQAIHGLSVETQKKNLEEWAAANHMHVVGVYADEGISARKRSSKRPALQRLLGDVRQGKIDLIIFTKLDRWFRNVAEYYKVQEVLEQYRVNWRTIHEDYDTSTAAGRLKINIMLSVAQDEADRTSERIKVVFDNKKQKLEPITGHCPTGYKVEGKKIVKDPEKEQAVSAFFKKYMACGSISVTQEYVLSEYGVRILYQLASKMLDSKAYYGNFYGVDGMCPAYITKEQYEKIQSMRQRVVRKTIQNRVYLFSGLLVCGECGRRMNARVNNKIRTIASYTCPGHYSQRTGCGNNRSIVEGKIEAYLMETIGDEIEKFKSSRISEWRAQQGKSYKAEIASARSRLGKLKELFLRDYITIEEYGEERTELEKRIEELEEMEKPHEKPNFDVVDGMTADGWQEDYMQVGREEKREFWRILVKEIRFYPDRHIAYDLNL